MLILRTSYVLNSQKSKNLKYLNSSFKSTKQFFDRPSSKREFNVLTTNLSRPNCLSSFNRLSSRLPKVFFNFFIYFNDFILKLNFFS